MVAAWKLPPDASATVEARPGLAPGSRCRMLITLAGETGAQMAPSVGPDGRLFQIGSNDLDHLIRPLGTSDRRRIIHAKDVKSDVFFQDLRNESVGRASNRRNELEDPAAFLLRYERSFEGANLTADPPNAVQ